MIPVASFDQLSIVSDLHMGGLPGCQIFDQGPLLAAYIDHLRETAPGDCALLINGDTVDFLAEPGAKYFDPEGAIAKLDRIIGDSSFAPVWAALNRFVSTPRRHLIFTLGNHDLELALPWVNSRLLDVVSGGSAAARNRITTAFEGAGYACKVGSASVLCLHGNEVDEWNFTDYEALRRIICDLVQGRLAANWIPNAGTKLVIDVMNDLKREHAFVDLLKPEKAAAVRILAVMRPDWSRSLAAISRIAGRRVWDGTRRLGFLSAVAEPEEKTEGIIPAGNFRHSDDIDMLLDWAENELQHGTDPLELVDNDQEEQLGSIAALVRAISGSESFEIAWAAVKELASDSTFDVRRADPDFDRLDALAGSGFEYVVAGHTHLARVVGRRHAKGIHYNSGTWATMMRLTARQLLSARSFEPVFEKLRKSRTVLELGDLTFRRPTVVTILKTGTRTEAALEVVFARKGKVSLGPVRG